MPPRLSKRQQREKEALSGLGLGSSAEDDDSSQNEATSKSTFATLGVTEIPTEESEPEEIVPAAPKSTKSKKKKKKSKNTQHISVDATNIPPPPPPSSKAEKKSKGKAKKKDDVDIALEALALAHPDPSLIQSSSSKNSPSLPSIHQYRTLLSISAKYLDSDSELRRFFGSKVVNSSKGPSKQLRNTVFRSQITHPPSTWLMQRTSQGLAMRPLDANEARDKIANNVGDRWWTVDHSPSYREVQLQFLQTVHLGGKDHAGFMHLLRDHPWHIDTLLQMSEVARHQEDNTQASDFVERAMFAFERSFTATFNFTTGLHRLDFSRIENRAFFLALHRHITNLLRRGTMRTAFEFSRLLLSLDPHADPHGALLYIDYLAPKAGMNEWLVEMWDTWGGVTREIGPPGPDDDYEDTRVEVESLPGWMWSRALALWNMERGAGDLSHAGSTSALREAIHTYPYVLPVLADKAGIALSGEVRGHSVFRISTGWDSFAPGESTLHLLSNLYAQRASSLWKVPEVAEWLRATLDSSLLSLLSSSKIPSLRKRSMDRYAGGTPQNVVRHLIVTESRTLLAFVSPHAIPSSMVAYDPVPPYKSLSSYDERYFEVVSGDHRRNGDHGFGRNHGQGGQWEREDEMAQRIVQEMLMAEIQRGRGIPGAFRAEDEHEDIEDGGPETEEDEPYSDDGDDVPEEHRARDDVGLVQHAGGLLQTVYGLLWGRRESQQEGNDGHDNA